MFARKLRALLVVAAAVVMAGGTATVAAAAPGCTLPTVSITTADQYEGSGGGTNSFRFTVRIAAGADSCGEGAVRYRTVERSAVAGSDFTATSGTVSWQAAGTRDVTVPVRRDDESEFDETFSVELYAPDNAVVTGSTATVAVLNDDAIAQKDIPDIETSFTPTGGICWWPKDYLWIPLQTNVTPRAPITVEVYSKDGTATSGKDYKLAADTVTFAEGMSKTTLPVEVLGTPTGQLYFHVVIKDVSAGVVVKNVATVTIKEC